MLHKIIKTNWNVMKMGDYCVRERICGRSEYRIIESLQISSSSNEKTKLESLTLSKKN